MDDAALRGKHLAVLCWSFILLLNVIMLGVGVAFAPNSKPAAMGTVILVYGILLALYALYVFLFSISFRLTGGLLKLGTHPHWVACGWLGATLVMTTLTFLLLFLGLFLLGLLFSAFPKPDRVAAAPGTTGVLGCALACFIMVLPFLVSWKVTSVITRASHVHSLVITVVMWLKLVAISIFFYICLFILILTLGLSLKTFLPSPGNSSNNPDLESSPDSHQSAPVQETPSQKAAREQRQEQERAQQERNRAAEEKRLYLESLTPAGRLFYQLGPEKSTPKFTQDLRKVIKNRTQATSEDFQAEFVTFMTPSLNKRLILDICLEEKADELAQLTYMALLQNSAQDEKADALIRDYLFTPPLNTSKIFKAASKLNSTLALEKMNLLEDKEPLLRDLIESITTNDPNAPVMAKIALDASDSKQREQIYALAFKPGIKPQTIEVISEHWKTNSPDTLSDVVKLYFKIASSTDYDPLDKDNIEALAAVDKPDRRVQKRIAALLLTSCRESLTPEKLKALNKWQSDETRRSISDSLMAITNPSQADKKTADLRLAEELEIGDPIDHLAAVACSASPCPAPLLDYLRTNTLRVEQLTLAVMEQKEFKLSAIENEIQLMEEMGWKTARQTFIDQYKSAKTQAEKKRFQDAESKLQRYIAVTIRNFPNNNPDKPPFKPHGKPASRSETSSSGSGDGTLFSSDGKTGPKSLNNDETPVKPAAVKISPGDIVQITSVGATEFATVAKIEPELVTVTLIKNDKMDFISRERIVKVVGTVDSPGLVEKLKVQMKGGNTASDTPKPDTAKPDTTKPASAPTEPSKPDAAPAAVANKPAVGMKVEAKKFDEWHDATIEKIGNNQCYVTFDGKGGGWDGWLGLADLRPRGSKKTFMMLSMD